MSAVIQMLGLLLGLAVPASAAPVEGAPTAVAAAVCRGDLANAWSIVKSTMPRADAQSDLVAAAWLAAFFRDASLQAVLQGTLSGMASPAGPLVDACSGQPIEIEWREIIQRLTDRNLDRLPIPTTPPRTDTTAAAPVRTAPTQVQASPRASEKAPALTVASPGDSGRAAAASLPAESKPSVASPSPPQDSASRPRDFSPMAAKPVPTTAPVSMGTIQVGAARNEASVPAIVARALGAIPHLVTAEDVIVLPPGSGTNGLYLVRLQTTDPRGACAELSTQRIPCLVQTQP